jgi:hypothetical protein
MYFAILRHRSGNLWSTETLHGVGDFSIDGFNQEVGMPQQRRDKS